MNTKRVSFSVPLLLLSLLTALLLGLACGSEAIKEDWELVETGLPGALTSVWGTEADDIWAVGADRGDGNGPTVMRYEGSQWVMIDTGRTSGDLWWVFGFDDGPVFLGGKNGLILKYEDGNFREMSTPGTATVYGIWGSAPDDVWAVGGNVTKDAFAWRYDGEVWSEVEGIPPEISASESLFKVWGKGSGDVWMVGTGGLTLRYNGLSLAHTSSGTTKMLFTTHADYDLFAAVGGLGDGVILENDGSGWNDVTPKGTPHVMGLWLDGDDGYAAGVGGAILRRDAGEWKRVDTGLDLKEAFHAVWIDPEGGVWAVGGQVLAPPLVDGVVAYRRPAVKNRQ